MRGTVVQYSITDIDTGLLLWTRSATTEYCPSGSFGPVQLRTVVNDGVIRCYMNDRCYVSVTDDEPLTGTGVGVFADLSDTEFANFNVTIIEGWNIPVDENGKLDESLFKDTQHLNYLGYNILNARTHAALAWAINGNEGDLNDDGEVQITDVMIALKSMMNGDNYLSNADRNFDGEITFIDILRILKAATK